jgi:hypothetical protein
MTAVDDTGEPEAAPERVSRGVRITDGGELRLGGFSISFAPDGTPTQDGGEATVEVRTDMWPFWLEEAIDAAIAAAEIADKIPPLYEQFEAGNATDEDFNPLLSRELRATMRTISACAFAIDAFYASVKARSPRHPDQDAWNRNKTARHTQVTETLFYHLQINKESVKKKIRSWVSQIYKFRDSAVHPGSEFREPIHRSDLNVSVDWYFGVFRRENAVSATAMAIAMFDYFVSFMDKGKELAEQKPGARRKLDAILDRYEAASIFPAVQRSEPPADA